MDIVGTVLGTAEFNGFLYIVGSFAFINGQLRRNFAVIDLSTGDLAPLSLTFDAPVYSVTVCGSVLAFAGIFKNVNGSPLQALAIYDPSTGIIRPALQNTGYNFVNLIIPTVLFCAVYHPSTDILYFGGQFGIGNGGLGPGVSQLAGLAVTANQVKPFNLGFPVNNTIPSISQTVCRSLTIDTVNHKLYAIVGPSPNFARSYDVTDPDNTTLYTWLPIVSSPGSKLYYQAPFVYVGAISANYAVNGIVRGLMATNAVTGANDLTQDVSVYKQEFQGDTRVGSVLKNGNTLYVGGHFTDVKTPNAAKRSSFVAFDLGTNADVMGQFIDLTKIITINYITPFLSRQPASIGAMVINDNKVHLFGSILSVDGTLWGRGHYIVDLNGNRVQTQYIF